MVRDGHLMLKPLHPIPALRRGMRLHPDDTDDPWVFRVELPEPGLDLRVVFSQHPDKGRAVTRLLTDMFSFQMRPDARNPRRLAGGAPLAGAGGLQDAPGGGGDAASAQGTASTTWTVMPGRWRMRCLRRSVERVVRFVARYGFGRPAQRRGQGWKMLRGCVWTVFWLRNSSAVISGFVLRSTTSRAISDSRAVSAKIPRASRAPGSARSESRAG